MNDTKVGAEPKIYRNGQKPTVPEKMLKKRFYNKANELKVNLQKQIELVRATLE